MESVSLVKACEVKEAGLIQPEKVSVAVTVKLCNPVQVFIFYLLLWNMKRKSLQDLYFNITNPRHTHIKFNYIMCNFKYPVVFFI